MAGLPRSGTYGLDVEPEAPYGRPENAPPTRRESAMIEPELQVVLRRLDYVSDSIQQHAADDLQHHAAVLASIEEKSVIDRAERAKISKKIDEIAGLFVIWNTAKGLRSIVVTLGKVAIGIMAIGAAVKFILTWGRW
jgi:hypothetical protein